MDKQARVSETDKRLHALGTPNQQGMFKWVILFMFMFAAGMTWDAANAYGEGLELSVNAQKAWDTVLNKADASTKRSLLRAYESTGEWKTQEGLWQQKIKQLHKANADELVKLRKAIRETDAAKLTALQKSLEDTQARYEPLFNLYRSLNQQWSAAKGVQNKEWRAALHAQTETLKPLVKLAREDIRTWKAKLAEARKQKNAEIKRLRTVLNAATAVKKQIQTAQKKVSLARERYSNELRSFKQTLKKGDPARTLTTLHSLKAAAEKCASARQTIYTLEQKISEIYVKVGQEVSNRPK
ncbi:hypothetical protein [Paenibacillus silvae]|uniref:hypothetical protein n=1 Tax=Paenibacillus silvae TaxID=1325358 RepID=UPI002006C821|nr:hypothetical protein [Paenibacillus silvae]MCK6077768.1 hypothetical protein [Paenibacillus silvae]MCK6151967.1 hypothetical protein [Paenibacillus silvae]MCK6270652.1 hypothetical protein [Paenibacillus silvae]